MGLFSAIKGVLKTVPIIGTGFSANDSKAAARRANGAIQTGIDNAQGDIGHQLALTAANEQPFIDAGRLGLNGELGLTGLNGADAQQSAISGLQGSPLYQSLYRNGLDTILSNASATGGLRGGNTQSSLANFGSDTLAQVIQQQLANYGNIAGQGYSATQALGAFGAQASGALAGLDNQSGQYNSASILGQDAINSKLYAGLRSTVGQAAGIPSGDGGVPGGGGSGGDISSLLGQIGVGIASGGSGFNPAPVYANNNSYLSGLGQGQSAWLSTALQPSSTSFKF